MQLNEYLIRYNINKGITFGVAVVVAENINKANNLLKVQGNYNGSGYDYIILETVLINNTDQYNTSAILEEIATTSGDSAYDIAKKYGFKGTESEWLTSLKGDKGDKGEPLTWNTMDSKDKISLKEDIIKEIKSELSATPSGDPLHYAYESVGAVYNSNTGYWELNGLTDLTTEEMRVIYGVGMMPIAPSVWRLGLPRQIRTNIASLGGSGATTIEGASFALNNSTVEVINLTSYPNPTEQQMENVCFTTYQDSGLNYAFLDCKKLKRIYGAINVPYHEDMYELHLTDAFAGCKELEDVFLNDLGYSNEYVTIDFPDSPKISARSLAYLILNAVPDAYLQIGLTSDAYMKATDPDVDEEYYNTVQAAIEEAEMSDVIYAEFYEI